MEGGEERHPQFPLLVRCGTSESGEPIWTTEFYYDGTIGEVVYCLPSKTGSEKD